MVHEIQGLTNLSGYVRYQVEAARDTSFDADAFYAVTDWFDSSSGEQFTPYGSVECEQIALRARASFCWDYSDAEQTVFTTAWSSNYDHVDFSFVLPNKVIVLDAIAPSPVTTLQLSSTATVGDFYNESPHGVVDVNLFWDAVEDRLNGNDDSIGMIGGGYHIYRYLAGSPDYTEVYATVLSNSNNSGPYEWVDLAENFSAEGENFRGYAYEVRPFDAIGNERTMNNDFVAADLIPLMPEISGFDNSETLAFSWTPLDPDYVGVTFILERTLNRDHLGSDEIFHNESFADSTEFRIRIVGDGLNVPTGAQFTYNSAFSNPSEDLPVYYHIKAKVHFTNNLGVVRVWESPWSDVETYPSSGDDGTKGMELEDDGFVQFVNFSLDQNFPNPFNPQTTIKYRVPRPSHVDLRIYDVRGQLVRTLVDGTMETGGHSVQWYGEDQAGRAVSTGIYFYKLVTPDETFLKRMVLMR